MSVLTLTPETYNYIRSGLEKAAYNNVCDEFFYSPIHTHFRDKDIETEIQRLIASWCDLNYKSYAFKYKEKFESFAPFIVRDYTHKPMSAIQLCKYVECLSYNIEPEHWELTEQEKQDLELLNKTREAIVCAIVGSLPEYKAASWSH